MFGNKNMTFDNNGNLQTITDPSGTTTYTWNTRNQLTNIGGPGVTASFVYDGSGRREKKTINGELTEFLYDRLNPVQETSGVPVLANILPGIGIDEFFSRTDTSTGSRSSFLTDTLGSVIALADSSGVVQTEYSYEPFGPVRAECQKRTSTSARDAKMTVSGRFIIVQEFIIRTFIGFSAKTRLNLLAMS